MRNSSIDNFQKFFGKRGLNYGSKRQALNIYNRTSYNSLSQFQPHQNYMGSAFNSKRDLNKDITAASNNAANKTLRNSQSMIEQQPYNQISMPKLPIQEMEQANNYSPNTGIVPYKNKTSQQQKRLQTAGMNARRQG